ncbi:YggT family protein [Dechloromonas sp.]|uniref:YggT family protein n=1 Tax=Dechloromonas sp. TaxID=1917218 RepID=UPI0011F5D18A|nr:YggT family protein [Dechloromonas sp.]MBU3695704.1 YggT family protein [Dechloromonas sp.]TEX46313.1 MAG: YggT family protein [Rhodocyclaceae bacterium]
MQAVFFLLNAVVSFFCTLFLLRFMMQMARVSFAGQIGDFVVKTTNWAVKPLRRIVPGMGGVDWASLIAALWLQLMLSALVISLSPMELTADSAGMVLMILMLAIRGLIRLAIYIVIGALILQAVLSWINPFSPVAPLVNQLSRPILDPIRRFVPSISGVDLSPLVAILLLQVVLMFV